jgi:hypothetical protein
VTTGIDIDADVRLVAGEMVGGALLSAAAATAALALSLRLQSRSFAVLVRCGTAAAWAVLQVVAAALWFDGVRLSVRGSGAPAASALSRREAVGMSAAVGALCLAFLLLLFLMLARREEHEKLKSTSLQLCALFYDDELHRVLATRSYRLPTATIDLVYEGKGVFDAGNQDFLRMLKATFTWSTLDAQRDMHARLIRAGRLTPYQNALFEKFVAAARKLADELQIALDDMGMAVPHVISVSAGDDAGSAVLLSQRTSRMDHLCRPCMTESGHYVWVERHQLEEALYKRYGARELASGSGSEEASWLQQMIDFPLFVSRPLRVGLYVGMCYTRVSSAGLEVMLPRASRNMLPVVQISESPELDAEAQALLQRLAASPAAWAELVPEIRVAGASRKAKLQSSRKAFLLLDEVAAKARADRDLVQRRSYHGLSYGPCMVGREFVQWLKTHGYARNDDEAVALGRRMVAARIIHHVCHEHDFKNKFLYYRIVPPPEFVDRVHKLELASFRVRLAHGLAALGARLGSDEHICSEALVREGATGPVVPIDVSPDPQRPVRVLFFSHSAFQAQFPRGYDSELNVFAALNTFEIFFSSLRVLAPGEDDDALGKVVAANDSDEEEQEQERKTQPPSVFGRLSLSTMQGARSSASVSPRNDSAAASEQPRPPDGAASASPQPQPQPQPPQPQRSEKESGDVRLSVSSGAPDRHSPSTVRVMPAPRSPPNSMRARRELAEQRDGPAMRQRAESRGVARVSWLRRIIELTREREQRPSGVRSGIVLSSAEPSPRDGVELGLLAEAAAAAAAAAAAGAPVSASASSSPASGPSARPGASPRLYEVKEQ